MCQVSALPDETLALALPPSRADAPTGGDVPHRDTAGMDELRQSCRVERGRVRSSDDELQVPNAGFSCVQHLPPAPWAALERRRCSSP